MPVSIKGVDPALEPSVTDVKTAMQSGSLDALTTRGDDVPGIVLGKDLAAFVARSWSAIPFRCSRSRAS